ncbi:MAG: phosphotransferase [Pseudomonadales bacterium]
MSCLSDFQSLSGGYTHQNYRLRYTPSNAPPIQCVVRLPHRELSEHQRVSFRWELDYLQSLGSQRLPVCEVLGAHVLTGILLTRWYDGQHLHRVSGSSAAACMQRIEDALAQLPAQTRRYDPLAQLSQLDSTPSWIRRLASSCANWLDGQDAQLRPCHNDLNPYNLLCSEAGDAALVILDWEMAGLNHPGFDLVTAHVGLARERVGDEPTARAALQQRLGQETAAWLLCCYWLREWAWAMAQLAAGNRLEAVQDQASLALRELQVLTPN